MYEPDRNRLIVGLSGQKLPVVGRSYIDLTVGNNNIGSGSEFKHDFIVCGNELAVHTDGLIGLDFLRKFKARIDYNANKVELGNACLKIAVVQSVDVIDTEVTSTVSTDIRAVESTADTTSQNVVRLKENLVIPARSEVVCLGVRQSSQSDSESIMIEPVEIPIHGILAARVVARTGTRDVAVKLMNVSQTALNVPGKTIIGLEETVTEGSITTASVVNTETIAAVQDRNVEELFALEHLSTENRKDLLEVLINYEDIFRFSDMKLGCTSKVYHRIITEDVHPIARAPYRVPQAQKKVLNQQIDDLLNEGIISESESPWSAPVILVNRVLPDGSTKVRLCIDFRELNKVTKKDFFPLPNLQETLEQLNQASLFTTLDLASGYHQVPMADEDKEKTGFSTPWGHYEWNRMPFGLTNAPSTWQRLMYAVLSGLTGEKCYVYLDDIIIFSGNDVNEHLSRLKAVFDRMRTHNLKLKPDKCKFMMRETSYLGHLISGEGVKPDPNKVLAIQNYPVPTKLKDVRAFLGLVGFYRRFIPKFADLAKPLTILTKKDQPFIWSDAQKTAFSSLCEALQSNPVLRYPDFSLPFVLSTDASEVALGAVLSQRIGGFEHPIAYASRALNKAESNYSAIERECLGIVWAVKFFRCYVYGRRFTVTTDHRPLKWLMEIKDPSSRLSRWSLTLAEYDFEVVHRSGKANGNADALSRVIVGHVADVIEPVWDRDHIKSEQDLDPAVQRLKFQIQTGDNDFFVDHDGLVYKLRAPHEREDKLVAPQSMWNKILRTCHDLPQAGHEGYEKTLSRVRRYFHWNGMTQHIKKYCQECVSCNQRKTSPHHRPAPLQRFQEVLQPFERTSMDIVGPLVTSSRGNKYILTFQDEFTRYPEAIAIPDQRADTVARAFVTEIIARHGVPKQLLTDRGTNFVSEVFKKVCTLLRIKKLQTTAYHPMCNGRIERFHKTLKDCLSHYIAKDQADWDLWLPYVLMALRSSSHSATGETPFFLLHGREFQMPFDDVLAPQKTKCYTDESYPTELSGRLHQAYTLVRERLQAAAEKNERQYNKNTRPVELKEGDFAYLLDVAIQPGLSRKLGKPWKGPYKIVKRTSPVNFVIKDISSGKEQVVHVNRLKLCRSDVTEEEEEIEEKPPDVAPDPNLFDFIEIQPVPHHLTTQPTIPDNDSEHETFDSESDQEELTDSGPESNDNDDDYEPDNDNQNEPPERIRTRSAGPPPDLPWISNARI